MEAFFFLYHLSLSRSDLDSKLILFVILYQSKQGECAMSEVSGNGPLDL